MAVKYIKFTGGPLRSNTYVVHNGREGFVVDAGVEPEPVIEAMKELSLKVAFIILTHGHFDHVFYASRLSKTLNAKIYIHELDLNIMLGSARYGEYLYGESFEKPENLVLLRNIEKFEVGELGYVKIIHTPGHTPGSVCVLVNGLLITGDTLFRGTVGRADLPGGSTGDLARSLAKLLSLQGDYKILPGHGPETSLERERRENRFLRDLTSLKSGM